MNKQAMSTQETRGRVEYWNDDKGYGFIIAGTQKVFFHISAMRGASRPQLGEEVFFIAAKDAKGRTVASHVRHIGLALDSPAIRRKPKPVAVKPRVKGAVPWGVLLLLLVIPALGLLKAWASQWGLWLLAASVVASLLALMLYASDKKKAREGEWRVSERRLQFIALLGGWPGALVAQQLFRHKNKKASFQVVFWFIVLCHQLGWLDYLLFNGGLVAGLVQAGLAS